MYIQCTYGICDRSVCVCDIGYLVQHSVSLRGAYAPQKGVCSIEGGNSLLDIEANGIIHQWGR